MNLSSQIKTAITKFQYFKQSRLIALFFHYQLAIIHCQLIYRGEYRSRTDDLLLAKQAL